MCPSASPRYNIVRSALTLLLSHHTPITRIHHRGGLEIRRTLSGASNANQGTELVFASKDMEVFFLHHTVDSTQDETKRLLEIHRNQGNDSTLAVIAENQLKGRGTSGRSWLPSQGNLYLTCAISKTLVPMSKVTLLPLCMGVIIAETLAHHATVRPTLKWPNDVLLDGKKVAGTLIESHRGRDGNDDWWLVGVGVNLMSHPQKIDADQGDFHAAPRPATSLAENSKLSTLPSAHDLGVSLSTGLQSWAEDLPYQSKQSVIGRWKDWANLGSPYVIRNTGEEVTTLDVGEDGQLRVRGQDGSERWLLVEYLY